MSNSLDGKTVAILATDGFEKSELLEPMRALEEAGAETVIVSPKGGSIKSWDKKNWGEEVAVDQTIDAANVDDFDALVLPGGVINPDKLRIEPKAVEFIRDFVESGKPIAAICHGPWTLIEAEAVRGRRMTSYKSIRTDLINAGAEWVDEAVVVDEGIITSRDPNDLPHFIAKIKEEILEGIHERHVTQSAESRM